MAEIYDNWEKLVRATLRREQLRLIALRTPSDLSLASSSPSFKFTSSPYPDDLHDWLLGKTSTQPVGDQPLEVKKPLIEVHPHELKFIFEVNRQSSCSVHLANLSAQHVAFKNAQENKQFIDRFLVKTTSPKKYCVRPNTVIVKPKSTCDFTVTMQAQRSVPLDMQCTDKFLIQSTVAPFGTSEADITPSWFAKDSGRYIEECKLRVFLACPSHSPALLPLNGVTNQEQSYVIPTLHGAENLTPPQMLNGNTDDAKPDMAKEELKPAQVYENANSPSRNSDEEPKTQERIHLPSSSGKLTPDEDVEERNMKFSEDIKELNSKLLILESKLIEAELTIRRLEEEKSSVIQENEMLKRQ